MLHKIAKKFYIFFERLSQNYVFILARLNDPKTITPYASEGESPPSTNGQYNS